jgi:hypothetical protein
MDAEEAWETWKARVGNVPPLGYVLRESLPERWFRVHALPGRRRVPRNHDERDLARYRHFVTASAVLGVGSDCLAFATTRSEDRLLGTWLPLRAWDGVPLADRHHEEVRGSITRYRAMSWGIPDGAEIVRRVAYDEFDGLVAVLSLATGGVYCPYDGGADFTLGNAASLATMELLFSQWTPDGAVSDPE